MKTINPKEISTSEFHAYLLGSVAPRPIAFVSTIDQNGQVNLSPFSFFNVFGVNPPTLVFSPARRVRDNSTKHTLENVKEIPEAVVNIVNYAMVEQMSLASTEYEKGVNEFIKAGLTEVPSLQVKPPGVAESPVTFECKVKEIIETGQEGGAGNLIVCEVLLAHIQEEVLDDRQKIDPFRLDAVARMGGNWYCRANGDALFEVEKPLRSKGIGVDQIPENIRNSTILTGNNLGKLGNVEALPDYKAVESFGKEIEMDKLREEFEGKSEIFVEYLHLLAKKFLETNEVENAWKVLLQI